MNAKDLVKRYIEEFAVNEYAKHDKRAKRCGCRNCKLDSADANDRMDWLLDTGRWAKRRIVIDKGPDGHIEVDDLPWDPRQPA